MRPLDQSDPSARRPATQASTQPPPADPPAPDVAPIDMNAGKTFKPATPRNDSAKSSKRPGPGRPRKNPEARGSVKAEGATGLDADRPGKPLDLSVDAVRKIGQACGYAVGSIECLALRIDLMQGLAVWKFSDIEKDLYADPGARVLNKYAPEWWAEYSDEIELATVLIPMFVSRAYMLAMIKYPHLAEKIAGMLAGQKKTEPGPELVPDQPGDDTEAADHAPSEQLEEVATFAGAGA